MVPGVPLKKDAGGLAYGDGTPCLNPAAFKGPPTTPDGVPLRLGYSTRYVDGLRGEMRPSEDFGLFKRFPIKEKSFSVEFRTDFFNFLNRAGRGHPNTNLDDAAFGKITGPACPYFPAYSGAIETIPSPMANSASIKTSSSLTRPWAPANSFHSSSPHSALTRVAPCPSA